MDRAALAYCNFHLSILRDTPCLSPSPFLGQRTQFLSRRLLGRGLPRVQKRQCSQWLILMRQSAERENGFSGDDPPETLFMRELRRRGISSTSSSGDSQTRSYGPDSKKKEGDTESTMRAQSGPTVKLPSDLFDERSRLDQRERSMALNSEGLDGLIPRAQILLTLGGSSFLAFWPLILSSLTIFLALYIYFGASFIHLGSGNISAKISYVDPYQLLEKESLPPEIGPSRVPLNYLQ